MLRQQFIIFLTALCFVLAGLVNVPANAQGFGFDDEAANIRITKEAADKFFDECTENPDVIIDGQPQIEMCACMSVQLQDSITRDEYAMIEQGAGPGTEVWAKFLTYVHGPCMEYPVKDYVLLTCLDNVKLRDYVTDIYGMCDCLANRMSVYTNMFAASILSRAFKDNPHYEDALTAVTGYKYFVEEQRLMRKQCMTKYSYDNEEDRLNEIKNRLPLNHDEDKESDRSK